MKKEQKSVEELLNEAKTYWICPITSVQIDAENINSIEKHKATVLKQLEQNKIEKVKAQEMKILNKEFTQITTLEQLNDWTKKVFAIKHPTVSEDKIPKFSVPVFTSNFITKNNTNDYYKTAILQVVNYTKTFQKTFQIFNIFDNLNKEKDVFAITLGENNPFLMKVFEYQLHLFKAKTKTVGLEEKAILQKNKEYCNLIKEIKSVAQELHILKEQHATINKRMAEIREQVLGYITFDDFLATHEKIQSKKPKP